MELTGAALQSWQALAHRYGVGANALVRAVGIYLLDHERLDHRDLANVVALAKGLDDLRPVVDLHEAEVEGALAALDAAISAVDQAKRTLEQAGLRGAARALGEAQTALHDARRAARS